MWSGVANARRGDVELAVAEARRRQVNAHTLERLALRLVNRPARRQLEDGILAARIGEAMRSIASYAHGEGDAHREFLGGRDHSNGKRSFSA